MHSVQELIRKVVRELNKAPRHEEVLGSGGTVPLIISLGTI